MSIIAEFDAQRLKVDVDNFDVTVRELVRMVSVREIDRAAEYQRKFRWLEDRESKLVESVMIGLPVPTIFVATNKDGTWELVDGLQRLSSLVHFVDDPVGSYGLVGKKSPLVLSGLSKLKSFNGRSFRDLPEPLQLHFLKRSLRVTAISDKSDLSVRFDTFQRLNTGGIALTAQEIRSCVFRGKVVNFLADLAKDARFRSLIKLQKGREDDGTYEEIILKTFAYYEARNTFDGAVTEFLNVYARSLNDSSELDGKKQLFGRVLDLLQPIFSGPILKKGYGVTPINLAEAILVATAELAKKRGVHLKPKTGWIEDAHLQRFSTKGTNTKNFLEGRINRARELLLGAAPSSKK